MLRRRNKLNHGTSSQELATIQLNGIGTTNTSVLNFAASSAVGNVGTRFAGSNNAADGWELRPLDPGVYRVEVSLAMGNPGAVNAGISVDATDAELLSSSIPSEITETMKRTAEKTNIAGAFESLSISVMVRITKAMVSAGLGVIRAHAFDPAGIINTSGVNSFRVLKHTDLND